jgi:hypothetical protein
VVEQEPSLRNKVMALLPYYAGLRIAEVVGLDIDDISRPQPGSPTAAPHPQMNVRESTTPKEG